MLLIPALRLGLRVAGTAVLLGTLAWAGVVVAYLGAITISGAQGEMSAQSMSAHEQWRSAATEEFPPPPLYFPILFLGPYVFWLAVVIAHGVATGALADRWVEYSGAAPRLRSDRRGRPRAEPEKP